MIIYFVLLSWSVISSVVFLHNGRMNVEETMAKKIYFFINYIPLVIVSGIRSPLVGSDTAMYHEFFYRYNTIPFEFSYFDGYSVEIGFRIASVIAGIFLDDSQVFMFLVTAVLIFGYGYFFYKFSCNLWLTTFFFIGLFFYCESMNSLRQNLTIMIVCNGLVFLQKNELKKWFITILLASLFHFSGILYLFFTPLKNLTKNNFYLSMIFPISGLLLAIFSQNIVTTLFADTKYMLYFNVIQSSGSLGDVLRIGLYAGCLIFAYKYWGCYTDMEKNCVYISSAMVCTAVMTTISEFYVPGFYRCTLAFSPFIVILLPSVLKYMGTIKLLIYPMIFLCTVLILYYQLLNNFEQLYYRVCF